MPHGMISTLTGLVIQLSDYWIMNIKLSEAQLSDAELQVEWTIKFTIVNKNRVLFLDPSKLIIRVFIKFASPYHIYGRLIVMHGWYTCTWQ